MPHSDIITVALLRQIQMANEVIADVERRVQEKVEEQDKGELEDEHEPSVQVGPSTSTKAGLFTLARAARYTYPPWQQMMDAFGTLRDDLLSQQWEYMQSLDSRIESIDNGLEPMDNRLQQLERSWREHHDPSSGHQIYFSTFRFYYYVFYYDTNISFFGML